jgi:hypothetical protein
MVVICIRALLAYCLLAVACLAATNRTAAHSAKVQNFTIIREDSNYGEAKASHLASIHASRLASATASPLQAQKPKAFSTSSFNATDDEIRQARVLVAAAHASQAAYNKDRIKHPNFNNYHSRHGNSTASTSSRAKKRSPQDAVPHPVFSDETLKAIKPVGMADSIALAKNGTRARPASSSNSTTRRTGSGTTGGYTNFKPNGHQKRDVDATYWLPDMDHLGTQPFGGDDSYQVCTIHHVY